MYHFIVNLTGGSGKAKKTWDRVSAILEKNNVEYTLHQSEYEGHSAVIAKELTSGSEEVNIVIVGGDGTINEVLNGIVDFSKVKFGVIPTGSGNDFARGLKIPLHFYNTKKVVKSILNSSDNVYVDLGLLTTESGKKTIFGISSGIGMDAIVCKNVIKSKLKAFLNKLHIGNLIYVIYSIHTILTMDKSDVKIKFDDEEEIALNKLIFFAAMNLKAEGGGVNMAPKAEPANGKLTACVASGIPRWQTLCSLPLVVLGLHKNLKGFMIHEFSKAKVTVEEPFTVHTDGEYAGEEKTVVFECLPTKLRILMK